MSLEVKKHIYEDGTGRVEIYQGERLAFFSPYMKAGPDLEERRVLAQAMVTALDASAVKADGAVDWDKYTGRTR